MNEVYSLTATAITAIVISVLVVGALLSAAKSMTKERLGLVVLAFIWIVTTAQMLYFAGQPTGRMGLWSFLIWLSLTGIGIAILTVIDMKRRRM